MKRKICILYRHIYYVLFAIFQHMNFENSHATALINFTICLQLQPAAFGRIDPTLIAFIFARHNNLQST